MSVENQTAIELSEQELDVVAGGTGDLLAGIDSGTNFEALKSLQFAANESNAQGSKNIGLNINEHVDTSSFLDVFAKK